MKILANDNYFEKLKNAAISDMEDLKINGFAENSYAGHEMRGLVEDALDECFRTTEFWMAAVNIIRKCEDTEEFSAEMAELLQSGVDEYI